jgi:hypothetical protein
MISYNKIILIIFISKNLSRICVAGTDNGNTEDPDIEWLTPTTKYHVLKNTGLLKKKMPDKFLTKPYETPPVEAPHPGRFFIYKFTEAAKMLHVPPNRNNTL